MKILITGAAGRVAQYVRTALSDSNLTLFDRVPGDPSEGRWVQGELSDGPALARTAAGQDVIVHLAAIPDPVPTDSYAQILETNVEGTLNVLQAARAAGVKRVVIASSICATGLIYWKEPWTPEYLPLDEKHPCRPDDNYGASKLMCETLARGFWVRHGIEVVALRLCGVFFPDDPRSVARYDPWLKNPDGELVNRLWSYVAVDDVASAFRAAAMAAGTLGFQVLNIAARDSALGDRDLRSLGRHYPDVLPSLERFLDQNAHTASLISTKAAKTVLGWEAQRSYLESFPEFNRS